MPSLRTLVDFVGRGFDRVTNRLLAPFGFGSAQVQRTEAARRKRLVVWVALLCIYVVMFYDTMYPEAGLESDTPPPDPTPTVCVYEYLAASSSKTN